MKAVEAAILVGREYAAVAIRPSHERPSLVLSGRWRSVMVAGVLATQANGVIAAGPRNERHGLVERSWAWGFDENPL